MAIKGSDLDVLVYDRSIKFVDLFNQTQKILLRQPWVDYCERIVCNVPILKVKDSETGLSIDICFNQGDSARGVCAALHMQVLYPELRPLYFVLKTFLRERNEGLD